MFKEGPWQRKGQAQSCTFEASTLITLFVKSVEIFKTKYLFQRFFFFFGEGK